MAEPVIQRVRVGPVADRQVHADRRDLHRSHDPVAEVQQALVLLVVLESEIAVDDAILGRGLADDLRSGGELAVVRAGLLDHARVLPGGPVALVGQCRALRGPAGRSGLFHADPRERAHAHQAEYGRDSREQAEHARHMPFPQQPGPAFATRVIHVLALDDPIPIHTTCGNTHVNTTGGTTNIGWEKGKAPGRPQVNGIVPDAFTHLAGLIRHCSPRMRRVSTIVEATPAANRTTPPTMSTGRLTPPVSTKFSWYGSQIAYKVTSLSCNGTWPPSL